MRILLRNNPLNDKHKYQSEIAVGAENCSEIKVLFLIANLISELRVTKLKSRASHSGLILNKALNVDSFNKVTGGGI